MTTMNESAGNLGQKYRTLFEIIRELENFIQRTVTHSPGPDLSLPMSEPKGSFNTSGGVKAARSAEFCTPIQRAVWTEPS